ncbi:MAG TPA: CvpA family protein [Candidatus Polarisedimenticolia bacterium]|jgi:membrane protein required for colicin V production
MSGSGFAAFDVIVVILLAGFALFGLLRGMVRLVFGFAAVILGWILGLRWCETVAVPLRRIVPSSGGGAGFGGHRIAAFILIFLGVVIAVGVLAWLVTRALGAVKLGWLNRMAGAALGLLVGILVLCAATVPLLALSAPDGGSLMQGSRLAPYAVAGGEYLKVAAPEPIRERFTLAAKSLLAAGVAVQRKAGEATKEITAPKPEPSRRPR